MRWSDRFQNSIPVWLVLIAMVVLSRFIAVWFLGNWDIVNDSGIPIKPFGSPAYLDYNAYRFHTETAWFELTRPFMFMQKALHDWREAWTWLKALPLKPGPVFPALLGWFGYERDPAGLSWVYLITGGLLSLSWAALLARQGAAIGWQVLVACFPAVIYYSFVVSTDLLYAVLIAFFYAATRSAQKRSAGGWYVSMALMVIALLTRPNALAMFPVLFCVAIDQSYLQVGTRLIWMAILTIFGAYMLVYYLPYFWLHEGNAVTTHYWGIYPSEFHEGLFPKLPWLIDKSVSWGLLAMSKLLYSVGLRPSYAVIDSWLVAIRALPGVVFLMGLLYGFLRGNIFDRIFVFCFLLPVYVGAAQERYLLAITPLLIMWAANACAAARYQIFK